jgi:hypothetical protein
MFFTIWSMARDTPTGSLPVQVSKDRSPSVQDRGAPDDAQRKADEAARQRVESAAEAKRRADAEADAKRRADAEAEERRRAAEAEAQRRADAEAEERRRVAAEAEAEARRRALADAEILRRAQEAEEARRRAEALEEERRRNPVAVFRLRVNHPNSVVVQFRSTTNPNKFWPGGDRMYVIKDYSEHTYRLSCEHGENICFGAWIEGSALNPYWGGGYRVREGCTRCCLTCPAFDGATWELEPSDARTPAPSITWNIRSNHYYSVSLVFYSSSRRGHEWPGGNQEYRLRDSSVHTFKISCLRGEKVCYGAWPTGNPRAGYWGAGFGGYQGCANCCRTCDGTESGEITLN